MYVTFVHIDVCMYYVCMNAFMYLYTILQNLSNIDAVSQFHTWKTTTTKA